MNYWVLKDDHVMIRPLERLLCDLLASELLFLFRLEHVLDFLLNPVR